MRENQKQYSLSFCFLTHSHSFYLVYLYFLDDSFRFITQRIQIGVQRCIAKYDSHATVDAGKRLAEDAQISVFFFRHFFHATILRTFLTRYRRRITALAPILSCLMPGIGSPKHSTQMKFELIQILRSCQCHHTGVMRTGGKFGEVNAILVAQEEFNSPKSGSRQSAGHFLCHFLRFFQVSRVNVRRLELSR